MIDPGRLRRAIYLDCQRVSPDRYLITGGSDGHIVVVEDGRVLCDCIDVIRAGDSCKHSLLVRLMEGDPAVVAALRQLVPGPSRVVRAA